MTTTIQPPSSAKQIQILIMLMILKKWKLDGSKIIAIFMEAAWIQMF